MQLWEFEIWAESAFQLLFNGEWRSLTVGQAVFIIFCFGGILSLFIEEGSFIGIAAVIVVVFMGWRYFENNRNSENLQTYCERCGGDGELDADDLHHFLEHDQLDDEERIKAFQDWMDDNHPMWLNYHGEYMNLRIGSIEKDEKRGYGIFGAQTKKAYLKFRNVCFSEGPCNLCAEN